MILFSKACRVYFKRHSRGNDPNHGSKMTSISLLQRHHLVELLYCLSSFSSFYVAFQCTQPCSHSGRVSREKKGSPAKASSSNFFS